LITSIRDFPLVSPPPKPAFVSTTAENLLSQVVKKTVERGVPLPALDEGGERHLQSSSGLPKPFSRFLHQ
jgi:hypothetical protein